MSSLFVFELLAISFQPSANKKPKIFISGFIEYYLMCLDLQVLINHTITINAIIADIANITIAPTILPSFKALAPIIIKTPIKAP